MPFEGRTIPGDPNGSLHRVQRGLPGHVLLRCPPVNGLEA